MRVNLERIKRHLLAIGEIGREGRQGYNRPAFSVYEKEAIAYVRNQLHVIGVRTVQDGVGNLFAKWGDATKPSILFGSHLDTVPDGGLYDGALGVVVGLECIQVLKEQGVELKTPLELVCFVGEEANPLGGTFGSRAVAGLIEQTEDFQKKLISQGFTWEAIAASKRMPKEFLAYLELHIEQGALLETRGIPIGVVTAIAGIIRLHVEIFGRAAHSGTTPMTLRDDALVKAARFVQEVSMAAEAAGGDIVATVGELTVIPGVANVVPGKVELTVEIRGSSLEKMFFLEEQLASWAETHCQGLVKRMVLKKPTQLSEKVQHTIMEAAKTLQVPYQLMYSGANHDANSMTALTEAGMIFIPSNDGVSHHPDEYSSWEDIECGANVMLETLIRLAAN